MIDWINLLSNWTIVALIFTNIGAIMASYTLFSTKSKNKKFLAVLAAIPIALFPMLTVSTSFYSIAMIAGLILAILFGMVLSIMFPETSEQSEQVRRTQRAK